MTRLADRRPPYCAACFQHSEGRHVDFEAAYDGPVIPGTPEPVPVDDLVICENCLAEAFMILDPQNLKETIRELETVVKDQSVALDAKDKTIRGAKATIGELVEHPVATFPGRPKLIGVSDEVRTLITKRRYERKGTSAAPKNSPRNSGKKAPEPEVAA